MKLKHLEHVDDYCFKLTFTNGEIIQADLEELIGHHVTTDALKSARIDPEWGCLEFNNGMVDIEPKTLYEFASARHCKQAA